MPRQSRRLAMSIVIATLSIVALAAPTTAAAATTGSGSWYWPVGTENFRGWDGWWVYRPANHSWHMAQDMPAPVGHAVYAVGDGTVLESGDGHGYGGVTIVLHKTAGGREFKAVYGHIVRASGTSKGAKVRAGQVIGRVNGDRHLHFGIHPGRAYPSDNNPYRGHTYTSSRTYGWTDPVKYLRANPRVIKYAPPLLPTVATITTLLPATVLGTAEGSAYWSIETSEGVTRYSRVISGDASATLAPDESLPDLNTDRYLATGSETGFYLQDRLPVITAAYSARTPEWGASVTITGTLRNVAGAPFAGAAVTLERSVDASSWTRVGGAITGLQGTWSMKYRPTRAYRVRVRFSPPEPFIPCVSAESTVVPHAGLRAPDEHAGARRNTSFLVAGMLAPRHPAGSRTVVLRFQRYEAGAWVAASTHTATNGDTGSITRYRHRVTLPAGRWRVRAETAADSLHAAKTTGWFTIVVR